MDFVFNNAYMKTMLGSLLLPFLHGSLFFVPAVLFGLFFVCGFFAIMFPSD